MERKKRSKGRGWESCYVKKIYGTFGVEMRAYGQKLVKFCTHTHTRTHAHTHAHTHAAKLVVEMLECTQSADNLPHSFTVLWEKEYFLKSNLFCPFTSVKSCPLVILPVLILKNILGSIYCATMTILHGFSFLFSISTVMYFFYKECLWPYVKNWLDVQWLS